VIASDISGGFRVGYDLTWDDLTDLLTHTKPTDVQDVQDNPIARDDKIILEEQNGAIVITERYVKRKKVWKKVTVRHNGEKTIVNIAETIEEKPLSLMIPACCKDKIQYLQQMEAGASRKTRTLIRRAIKLLREVGEVIQ